MAGLATRLCYSLLCIIGALHCNAGKTGVNENIQLNIASPFFTIDEKVYSLDDKSLRIVSTNTYDGEDKLGVFSAVVQQLVAGETRLETMTKNYSTLGATTYSVNFVDAVSVGTYNDSDTISTGFPCFEVPQQSKVGFLSYGGYMFGDRSKTAGKWIQKAKLNSGMDGGPLSLFDVDGNALVFSAMDEFMITSIWNNIAMSRVCHGVMSTVSNIPKHYSYTSIVVYSNRGINQAFATWGELLRRHYGRTTEYRDADMVNNYLGFWTDGGAYYFYNTEPNMTYQQTVLALKEEFSEQSIPYKYLQLDSWWYFKDDTARRDVTRWEPMPSIFPDGMRFIWDNIKMPLACHNRQWSHRTPYAKQNGGKYDFIVEHEHNISVPQDLTFWQDIFEEARRWGLTMYEQDHLNEQTDSCLGLRNSVTAARQWLLEMGLAARQHGLTLQYCMSYARHALQSLEIPVVTHARVSDDYRGGSDQWKIGVSSMFAHALGVAPFKDCFWTTTKYQPGNPYNLSETHPGLQLAASVLSTGPVAPADKLGFTNVTLLMRCCNSEGLILKPSRPALAIDDQILRMALGSEYEEGVDGEVWTTYSRIGRWYFGIILASGIKNTYSLTPARAHFNASLFGEDMRVYNAKALGRQEKFSDLHPLKLDESCTEPEFCLYYTAPVLTFKSSEVVLIGELGKVVPLSPQRVTDVTVLQGRDISVRMRGAPGEHVTFTISLDARWLNYDCELGVDGTATLFMKAGGSQCAIQDSEMLENTENQKKYENQHNKDDLKHDTVLRFDMYSKNVGKFKSNDDKGVL